jgi:hypothetical protein
MYLARLIPGRDPQVYRLTDMLCRAPRSWCFVAFTRGACAIDYTQAEAVRAARVRLREPRANLTAAVRR